MLEVPEPENPDLQDLAYPAPPPSTLAGAHSDYQSFLPHGETSCGANNIRVEGTNSGNNADYATLKDAFDAINAGTHTGGWSTWAPASPIQQWRP